MNAKVESRSGLSSGLDEELEVSDKIVFVLAGNIYAKGISELRKQVSCIRKTFKLLPLALNESDCEVFWAVCYKSDTGKSSESTSGYSGHLVVSGIYDSDFKRVQCETKLIEKAFYGSWPLRILELKELEGERVNLVKILEIKYKDDSIIVEVSDNMYRFMALKKKMRSIA